MSLVRFAMVCDKCNVRQEEYAGYLSRSECMDHVCKECAAEYDPDPPGRALCRECAGFCACCAPLLTEAEERNRACRMCL
jgi:hypothetical protein